MSDGSSPNQPGRSVLSTRPPVDVEIKRTCPYSSQFRQLCIFLDFRLEALPSRRRGKNWLISNSVSVARGAAVV